MQHGEVTQMITGSSAGNWALLDEGPLYLDRLTSVSAGKQQWLEADSHDRLAVYKPDVSLRLAWGLQLDRELSIEGLKWPDQSIHRFLVDAFYQGALVARWTLLLVDGGRSYLPDPERADNGNGWTASASEIALARLLEDLVGRPPGQFERYLKQSGIIASPDE